MLRSLLAFTLLALCTTAFSAPPAFVVQSKSPAALIAEGKASAKLAGGDAAVVDFDDWLENTFGEVGLKGLDLGKPLLAYAPLKGKATEAKLFVILPISKEAEFLELLERIDSEAAPVPGDKSLYRIGDDDDEDVVFFRFHKGAAHFVLRGTAEDLDAKTLPDPNDLVNAGESGLLSAIFRPGATEAAFRKSALEEFDKLVEELAAFPFLPPDFGKMLGEWGKSIAPLARAALEDAESIAVRLDREPAARDASVEITVTPKNGSATAKELAARKPVPNRFGGLADWPDAAAVLLVQQPSWNAEVRAALANTLKVVVKDLGADFSKQIEAPIAAILGGLIPPAKSGALEFGAVLTAPDKTGFGGAAFAISHSDPAALLKALRDLVEKPPEEFGDSREDFAKAVALNAAKLGDLAIHTIALKAFLPDHAKKHFGEKALLAVAFDKDALYVAFGPGAVELLKRLPALKPGRSGAIDLRANAKKLADWPKADTEDFRELVERTLGQSAELEPVVQLTVGGTGELKIRARLSLPLAHFFRELGGHLEKLAPIPQR